MVIKVLRYGIFLQTLMVKQKWYLLFCDKLVVDFADVLIKGRASKGNVVTKHAIKSVDLKEKGVSTLKPRKIWFDETVQRLNVDGRGELLGEFKGDDKLLIINQKGIAKTVTPEVTLHFDSDMVVLEKWNPKKPISAIYFNGEKDLYYVKRFLIETEDREDLFISDHEKSYLEIVSTDWKPVAELEFTKERGKDRKDNETILLEEFISVKGITAIGNQLTKDKVNQINLLDPLPYEEAIEEKLEKAEVLVDTSENKSQTNTTETNNDDSDSPETDESGQAKLF